MKSGDRQLQNKAHNMYKLKFLKAVYWSKFLYKKLLESIDLSATNGTFFTKGEIESNFGTKPTEEPTLNHWVNTTLNQLMIQFEPFRRCI